MRILFTSDLHGAHKRLLDALHRDDYTCWVDSGDLLPNRGRALNGFDWHHTQKVHQRKWFIQYKRLNFRITSALRGRPALLVSGNHDFFEPVPTLCSVGALAHDLHQGPFSFEGHTFAGCRFIPAVKGHWSGEAEPALLNASMHALMAHNPTVIVTHIPARGHLEEAGETCHSHQGSTALAEALLQPDHRVRYHLHGHIHLTGGDRSETPNLLRYNGAGRATIIDLDTGKTEVIHRRW